MSCQNKSIPELLKDVISEYQSGDYAFYTSDSVKEVAYALNELDELQFPQAYALHILELAYLQRIADSLEGINARIEEMEDAKYEKN